MQVVHPFSIVAQDLGKRYNRDWIFRGLNGKWRSGDIVGVSGANGSGKSTLLRVLSGFLRPTKGTIKWDVNNKKIDASTIYKEVSIAAPYVSLVEEFTLPEFLKFHFSFKARLPEWSDDKIIDEIGLGKITNRSIIDFSSGMKQRVKLASALLADTKMVLLDEPTTNLDEKGKAWFQDLLVKSSADRLIFIASNEENDFKQCSSKVSMLDFKN